MTPRHADIAFVLEAAEGVVALYAIDPGKQRVADHLDLAVRLAPGGHALAVAHYALLRVITHAAGGRSRRDDPRAAPLVLSRGGAPRHAAYPEEAAATALSTPFHVIAISANAALHPRSFLDAVARCDRAGADRVLVFAPARDVPYVKHKLAAMTRKHLVLAMPIDDTTLRREILRAQPALAARLAVEEALEGNAGTTKHLCPAFRRPAVLIVDDDLTTAILFAARGARDDADVALAVTPMEAFAHIVERPVDLLIVSATMRSDGGEPFYRVLWRLKPELKSRCVLATAAELASPRAPAPSSGPRRVVERPLTPDAIGRIVQAFARG